MGKSSLSKYSIGVGDRFAHQAEAQLQACLRAAKQGVDVIPVWNKSNREHNIIGSEPASVRSAAQIEGFAHSHPELSTRTAAKYLAAIAEAGRIYRKIEAVKGPGNFIPEISMDETDSPQTPDELLVILAAISHEKIPIQTI